MERGTAKVFFAIVGMDYLVARDSEVKRLREENELLSQQSKKIRGLAVKHQGLSAMTCPVCDLILDPEEEPRVCISCNVGLACNTWVDEEHLNDDTARQCVECDNWSCVLCFNEETQECGECNKIIRSL